MEYRDKQVIVCGMARSGIAAAKLLKRLGARVTLQDLKTEKELKINREDFEGIELMLGKNPDDVITEQDLVVLSPGIPADLPFILAAEKAGIAVISEVELAFEVCKAPVIAITGTNGKTTTTALTGEIFAKKFKTETVGNIGIPYSDRVLGLTENDRIVIENSSFQLEKIKTFKPVCAAVLNITPDHLNRHHSLENYINAKENIFMNMGAGDFVILNRDDPATYDMKNRTKARVFFFSRREQLKEGIWADEGSIYVNINGVCGKVLDIDEMNIIGGHNVENAMAAIGLAVCGGVELELIREALKEFKAVEHRIEYVTTKNGVKFYNDSKGTNPDAAIKAVYAMKGPTLLIAGGYNKGSDFTEWVDTFKGRVKYAAIIGEVKEQIKACCDNAGFKSYEIFDTFEDAVKACEKNAVSGDNVLLSPACASWDMFESYEERGRIFKELVRG